MKVRRWVLSVTLERRKIDWSTPSVPQKRILTKELVFLISTLFFVGQIEGVSSEGARGCGEELFALILSNTEQPSLVRSIYEIELPTNLLVLLEQERRPIEQIMTRNNS